jgi:hypothetical protein
MSSGISNAKRRRTTLRSAGGYEPKPVDVGADTDRQLLLQSGDQVSFDNTKVFFCGIGELTGGTVSMRCKHTS